MIAVAGKSITDCACRFKYLLLAIIIIAGATIRLVAWHRNPVISRDGVLYLQAAKHSTDNLESLKYFHQGPLLLKTIQNTHKIGISWEHAGVAINIIAGSLLILAVFWATEELLPDRILCALVSSALVAFNPMLIMLSHEVQRESLYLLFSTLAVASMFRAARKSSRKSWILAGVFTAIAASSRFEAMELLIIAPLAAWFLGDPTSGKTRFLKIGYYWGSIVCTILALYCWFGLSPLRFVNSIWLRIENII